MFTLIICIAFLSVTTDVIQGKSLYEPPEGFTVHKIMSTWEEAKLQCQSEGAVLASPINTELLDAMKQHISIKNTPYFIGTRASYYRGPFTSVEGVVLENMTDALLEMVGKLAPRDGNCLSMDQYNIRVVSCCARLPFMCYKTHKEHKRTNMTQSEDDDSSMAKQPDMPAEVTERSTTEVVGQTTEDNVVVAHIEPDESPLKCANDTEYKYYKLTGSCYKVHTEEKMWDDAESTCAAEGGHLIVIDDDNEAKIIKHLGVWCSKESFVGLRDFSGVGLIRGMGDWKSVTGKPLHMIYNLWYFDNPIGNHLCCAVVDCPGKLDSIECEAERTFICEIEV